MATGEQGMTVAEFGQRLGRVSRAAAYRIVAAGKVEVVNVSSGRRPRLRITEAALHKYLEQNKISARSS